MITLISFGALHGPAPEATLTYDLRGLLRDPHTSDELRELTGLDSAVRDKVMNTGNARQILIILADLIEETYCAGESRDITIAIGCAGGRHRSVVFAQKLYHVLGNDYGHIVRVRHRDIDKPVIRH
jgi:RNase adaptor protein for sRNA GlmZ degradation